MGTTLVASDGEVEFRTLRGEARVFCAIQGGIKTMGARLGFMYTQGGPSLCCEVYMLYVYIG